MKKDWTIEKVRENVKPCPFCGMEPLSYTSFIPSEVYVICTDESCCINPSLTESVADTSMFEKHYKNIVKKWNNRCG